VFAFLPVDLRETYLSLIEKLIEKEGNAQYLQFLKYFKENYALPSSRFNKYINYTFDNFKENEIAKVSNNHCEGYNSRLRMRIRRPKCTVNTVIGLLYDEENYYKTLCADCFKEPSRKKKIKDEVYKDLSKRIYEDQSDSLTELLSNKRSEEKLISFLKQFIKFPKLKHDSNEGEDPVDDLQAEERTQASDNEDKGTPKIKKESKSSYYDFLS